jgi:surface polysaccharide O-acyltransferase-like enzyme
MVKYCQSDQSIMSNDDTSYLYNEVGYASLALLLFLDILDYQSEYGEYLSGIS